MGFLRRLIGGGSSGGGSSGGGADERPEVERPAAEHPAVDEAERERALLLEDAARLDDDLIQRQLRYAGRAWTPPAQGGTRRAEKGDRPDG